MDKETKKIKRELRTYLSDTMGTKNSLSVFDVLLFPVHIIRNIFFDKKEEEFDDITNNKTIKTKSIQDVDDLTKTIDLSTLVDDIKKQDKEAKLFNVEKEESTPKETFIDKINNSDESDFMSVDFYEEEPSKMPKKVGMRLKLKDCLVDPDIDDYINDNVDKENSFKKLLFKFIDRTDLLDSDVYTNGGIDRRLFSKIRNSDNYHPSKDTVIQLAIGLKLNLDDLLSLLDSASYSLPMNNYFDLIIRFCFEKKIYNLMTINELLYDYKCRTLGRDD